MLINTKKQLLYLLYEHSIIILNIFLNIIIIIIIQILFNGIR